MTETKSELEAVLAYCNLVRQQLGLEPREKMWKGRRGQATSCPVTRTVQDGSLIVTTAVSRVLVEQIDPADGYYRPVYNRKPPIAVQRFIDEFDAGAYPELEA